MNTITDLKFERSNIFVAVNDKFKDILAMLSDVKNKKIYVNGASEELCDHCTTLKKELVKKV